jgi:hypothetical protein
LAAQLSAKTALASMHRIHRFRPDAIRACRPGMPRIMNIHEPTEIVITPDTIHRS